LNSILTNKNDLNTSAGNHVDVFEITCTLRKKIFKWQNSHTDTSLRMLKENTDYNIEVKPRRTQVGGCTAAVMCQICNERKHLGIDNKGCIKLSNWYRHVEKCINQNRKNGTPTTQIDRFFSSCKTNTA